MSRLHSPDAETRAAAAWELAGVGFVGTDGLTRLIELRKDPDEAVRRAAVWALAHADDVDKKEFHWFDTAPVPIRMTKPRYSREAFVQKIEGTVTLEVIIGERGEIAYAEVRRSLPLLDEAALACVHEWQFKPAMLDGVPTAIVARAPVTFTIF